MIRKIDGRAKSTAWIQNSLNRPSQLEAAAERAAVLSIIKEVREQGDAALLRYTREFDRAELSRRRCRFQKKKSRRLTTKPTPGF